ncbi:PaaI family thioesterase [Actinokineospora bangkokensis]|uniref:Thioesterase n=1 Tax=Actinokineospora bangkokensis TaxID=1193682 RepID=A0A1Q9LC90_9PSEU|nr:YiiD C-terminal domain-containing protein [Actinokineospora bangkokensis]OLR89642.1 thioesterase [Actinokineospora bangkokensis]
MREAFNEGLAQLIPVAHRMGVAAVELRPGLAVCRVPLEGNGNHLGTMYAGVLFTVAEVLGGALCLPSFDTGRFYPVVRDLKVDFRRPARSDVLARAELDQATIARVAAEAEEHGKAPFTLEAVLTDTGGTVVATTVGSYQLRKH